jgi:hypothetical protein
VIVHAQRKLQQIAPILIPPHNPIRYQNPALSAGRFARSFVQHGCSEI